MLQVRVPHSSKYRQRSSKDLVVRQAALPYSISGFCCMRLHNTPRWTAHLLSSCRPVVCCHPCFLPDDRPSSEQDRSHWPHCHKTLAHPSVHPSLHKYAGEWLCTRACHVLEMHNRQALAGSPGCSTEEAFKALAPLLHEPPGAPPRAPLRILLSASPAALAVAATTIRGAGPYHLDHRPAGVAGGRRR